ncbi:tubby C-terminal-like domain-containing protein [Blastocladiella britannica]|nr:tubby C-terminal-like domain-containing protein [Blastocladiella britannica]
MGNGLSKYESVPLGSYAENPIIVIDASHVRTQATTVIRIKQDWSWTGGDFTVTDMTTGELLYTLDARAFSLSQKQLVCDASGTPICNIKVDTGLTTRFAKFVVYRGANSGEGEDEGMALKVKAHMNNTNFELEVETADQGMLILKAAERDGRTFIWSGHPKQGGILIARCQREATVKAIFDVEVAPGVDLVAITTLLVMAQSVRDKIRRRREENARRRR